MNARPLKVVLVLAIAGFEWIASSADAVNVARDSTETSIETGRSVATNQSPVATFRRLLAMSPEERNEFVARYPADRRQRILDKVQEYQMLPPPYAEMRLQMTELRWYLLPLLKMSPAERASHLNTIPEPYRTLVDARLTEWDLIPPPLKEDVLEYETMMHFFVGRGAVVRPQWGSQEVPAPQRSALERQLTRWQELPAGQRQQMYASFERFLRLNEEEQQKILDSLSETKRQETARALEPIENWSAVEQDRYMNAFQKFAQMSAGERQQFMQSAARWQQMSEAERQAWRDLTEIISSSPPMPPGFLPPIPEGASAPVPIRFRTNPVSAPNQ